MINDFRHHVGQKSSSCGKLPFKQSLAFKDELANPLQKKDRQKFTFHVMYKVGLKELKRDNFQEKIPPKKRGGNHYP